MLKVKVSGAARSASSRSHQIVTAKGSGSDETLGSGLTRSLDRSSQSGNLSSMEFRLSTEAIYSNSHTYDGTSEWKVDEN